MPSEYFKQRLAEIKKSDLPARAATSLQKYVRMETTRHGRPVYYYRSGKGPRIRLPDPNVDAVAFNQAYLAASKGVALPVAPKLKALANEDPGRIGYIYFLRSGDMVKIGFAANVKSRLAALRTAAPNSELLLTIPGTQATERFLHAHFHAYRCYGEWFRLEYGLASFISAGG